MQELSCYWHSFTSSHKYKTLNHTEPAGSTNGTMKNHSVSHEKDNYCLFHWSQTKLKKFHRPSYLILGGNIWLWSNPGKTAGVSWWCAERSPPILSGWRQAWHTAESTSTQHRKRGRTKVKLCQVLNELLYGSGFIPNLNSLKDNCYGLERVILGEYICQMPSSGWWILHLSFKCTFCHPSSSVWGIKKYYCHLLHM